MMEKICSLTEESQIGTCRMSTCLTRSGIIAYGKIFIKSGKHSDFIMVEIPMSENAEQDAETGISFTWLKNPPILILDEAERSDNYGFREVLKSQKITDATIRDADEIIVITDC